MFAPRSGEAQQMMVQQLGFAARNANLRGELLFAGQAPHAL